jgi:hypothetical protein
MVTNKDESLRSAAQFTWQHFDDIKKVREDLPNHSFKWEPRSNISLADVQIMEDMLKDNSKPFVKTYDDYQRGERTFDMTMTGAWCGMTAAEVVTGFAGWAVPYTGALCVLHAFDIFKDSSRIGSMDDTIQNRLRKGKESILGWSEFKST